MTTTAVSDTSPTLPITITTVLPVSIPWLVYEFNKTETESIECLVISSGEWEPRHFRLVPSQQSRLPQWGHPWPPA